MMYGQFVEDPGLKQQWCAEALYLSTSRVITSEELEKTFGNLGYLLTLYAMQVCNLEIERVTSTLSCMPLKCVSGIQTR